MKNILEALLIATDAPLSTDQISEIVEIPADQIKQIIEELNLEYHNTNRAFEIKEVAGGFQIYTLPQYAQWVGELHKRKERLSKAALETLAIVAYHQPITRGEIEKARGVDSSWILEALLQKTLIKTCGRVQAPGRPIKYATTSEFLRYFGLNSLDDLPQEELFGEGVSGEPGPYAKIEPQETTAALPAETDEHAADQPVPPSEPDPAGEAHEEKELEDL